MSSDLEILNEIHKGLVMGMESLSVITSKVGDQNFKDDLNYQYERYENILNRVNKKYQDIGNQADDTSPMQKAMGWTQIQFNTIADKSNSHIAEMLIQGNTMGIIKGVKELNQNPKADKDIKQILTDFVELQQNNIEKLKTYL